MQSSSDDLKWPSSIIGSYFRRKAKYLRHVHKWYIFDMSFCLLVRGMSVTRELGLYLHSLDGLKVL